VSPHETFVSDLVSYGNFFLLFVFDVYMCMCNCAVDLTEQVSVEYVKHQFKVSFIGSTKEGELNPAASPH
jgi:hypothetical protein